MREHTKTYTQIVSNFAIGPKCSLIELIVKWVFSACVRERERERERDKEVLT